MDTTMARRAEALPTVFISHGGGPCFDMDWPGGNPFGRLRTALASLPQDVGDRPRALLVVSAHWEAPVPTVTTNVLPPLIYDYTNFPAHTYALRYDVAGSPELAEEVLRLLSKAGIAGARDARRGLDHGVFVPLRVIYPDADIPVVQLSIEANYDPARHLAIGAALAPLRERGVLIVGSGMSFHNLEHFRSGKATEANDFDDWLAATVTGDPSRRDALLQRWAGAPGARSAHPEEDHLVPLFVAAGAAAGERAVRTYADEIFGKRVSSFRFGGPGMSAAEHA